MIFRIENVDGMHDVLRNVCKYLEENGVSQDGVFNTKLAVTELVGNILKHAKAIATVSVTLNTFIELTVRSTVAFTAPIKSQCSTVFSESGRGLFLVDSVCISRNQTEDGSIVLTICK